MAKGKFSLKDKHLQGKVKKGLSGGSQVELGKASFASWSVTNIRRGGLRDGRRKIIMGYVVGQSSAGPSSVQDARL